MVIKEYLILGRKISMVEFNMLIKMQIQIKTLDQVKLSIVNMGNHQNQLININPRQW